MTSPEGSAYDSVVNIKIGNREYPAIRNIRCGVCMHPARFEIEARIMQSYTYASTVRWLLEQRKARGVDGFEEEWPSLSVEQLKAHIKKGHCPLDSEMVQALAERRAEELGFDLENGSGQFVDHVIASDIILSRAMEAILKGEAKPDVKDALAAAKLKAELENNAKSKVSTEQYQELFVAYFRVVQAIVDEQQWAKIMQAVANHPVVQAFQASQQRRAIEGN